MIDNFVRICRIRIENFKNVEMGEIKTSSFYEEHEQEVDILALYGQNGSGKTALIKAVAVLKEILTLNSLPEDIYSQISYGKDKSHFEFDFLLIHNNIKYNIEYQFDIIKVIREVDNYRSLSDVIKLDVEKKAVIENEVLKISGGILTTKQTVFDSSPKDLPFKPLRKLKMMFNPSKEFNQKLLVHKEIARVSGRSFLFTLSMYFHGQMLNENEYVSEINDLLFRLYLYGISSLCVIDNAVSLDEKILIQFSLEKSAEIPIGEPRCLSISLTGATTVSKPDFQKLKTVISNINAVLTKIIPGLSLVIQNLGTELMKNNEKGIRFELIAKRNETSIPLKFESEGIKKIISILHMLIVAFNNPGVTFVIDELDSGIYEYLLGELLAIFEMHGKGQLIFTSHNLRPLEMLDKQHLYFTTTNPKNRYIQLTNIDTNHNVRLSYFRSILLGGQKEQLYEETTRTDIARAFRNAGEVNGEE